MILLRWKLLKIFITVVIIAVAVYFLIRGVQNGVIAS